MMDQLFGNLGDQEKKVAEALAQIEGSTSMGDDVLIRYKANGELLQLHLSDALLNRADGEEIEDLLITAITRMLRDIKQQEATVSKQVLSELLPPGMAGLFGS